MRYPCLEMMVLERARDLPRWRCLRLVGCFLCLFVVGGFTADGGTRRWISELGWLAGKEFWCLKRWGEGMEGKAGSYGLWWDEIEALWIAWV